MSEAITSAVLGATPVASCGRVTSNAPTGGCKALSVVRNDVADITDKSIQTLRNRIAHFKTLLQDPNLDKSARERYRKRLERLESELQEKIKPVTGSAEQVKKTFKEKAGEIFGNAKTWVGKHKVASALIAAGTLATAVVGGIAIAKNKQAKQEQQFEQQA